MSLTKPICMLACFSVLILMVMALRDTCTSKEDLFPCNCELDSDKRIVVSCYGLDNDRDLTRVAIKNLRGLDIYIFRIAHSTFNFIPHDAFKGVKITWLQIDHSTLWDLTDTDEAFVGLERTMNLDILQCVLLKEVDWSIFRNLKELERLYFQQNTLETIEKEMSALTSLKHIDFYGNRIASIEDHAFSTMKDITYLFLNQNQIKYLKRTMLPNPALKLSSIGLR